MIVKSFHFTYGINVSEIFNCVNLTWCPGRGAEWILKNGTAVKIFLLKRVAKVLSE